MSDHDFDPALVRYRNRVISGRDLDLIEACPATGVFALRERDKPGFAQWWGIFIGKFLEYAVRFDRDYALEYIEQKYARALNTCAKIDVDSIIALRPDIEPEMCLDTATREVTRIEHKEAVPERHIHTRADIIFERGGRPHVGDYKSGDRTYDPASMSQMWSLATKVWLERGGRDEAVDVSIINVHSTGDLRWSTATLAARDLERYAGHMRRVHLGVLMSRRDYDDDGEHPPRTPGKHCRWCSLKEVCPSADQDALKREKRGPRDKAK